MKRRARITLKVDFIRTCICVCLVDVEIQGRVGSRLTFFSDFSIFRFFDVSFARLPVTHRGGHRLFEPLVGFLFRGGQVRLCVFPPRRDNVPKDGIEHCVPSVSGAVVEWL